MSENGTPILKEQLNSIEQLIEQRTLIDTSVSKVEVAWHLDHMLKTINGIYDSLKHSDTNNYAWNLNFSRSFVYLTGTIPRGRAQSPESVRPPDVILEKDLFAQLSEARKKMSQVGQLSENANFNHPVFDQLDRDQSIRFIEIHTNHHLKIIDDILN